MYIYVYFHVLPVQPNTLLTIKNLFSYLALQILNTGEDVSLWFQGLFSS